LQSLIEQKRQHVSRNTDAKKKSRFGQFLTPERTARFMANLFPAAHGSCRLLDAGAGIGSLSIVFIERWKEGDFQFDGIELDAFEMIDEQLGPYARPD